MRVCEVRCNVSGSDWQEHPSPRWRCLLPAFLLASAFGFAGASFVQAEDVVGDRPPVAVATQDTPGQTPETAAQRGYQWLTTKCYLPPDFDQEIFDNLWQTWPREQREQAQQATPAERRRMLFSRYGLMERPGTGAGTGPALGYVDNGKGGWVMNCLACHAGKVAGQVIPGVPNSHFALQTLTEDSRTLKVLRGQRLAHLDLASLKIPLGGSHGTTNSVIFGVILGRLRDQDLNYRAQPEPPEYAHHDMDAPPFWNVRKKKGLYADGFAAHTHRPLMQFMMLPTNSGATLRSWEPDFKEILAWIESLEPPRYRWPVDAALAARGETVFRQTCARCHGTYGVHPTYPARIVPLDEVGTDPVRLHSLSREYRQGMQQGWFGNYGKDPYVLDPGGYVAPPLDGIWATAPYFHNGSVPTLWHVLHPERRPIVWRRTEDGYDTGKVGLEVTTLDSIPETVTSAAERRSHFDTRVRGKSSAGHPFADELSDAERDAVLEYLKSL